MDFRIKSVRKCSVLVIVYFSEVADHTGILSIPHTFLRITHWSLAILR